MLGLNKIECLYSKCNVYIQLLFMVITEYNVFYIKCIVCMLGLKNKYLYTKCNV